jgi:hypothetical protein
MRRVVSLVGTATLIAACTGTPRGSASADAGATAPPASSVAATNTTGDPSTVLTASDAGLTLTVALGQSLVAPGDAVTVAVTIANGRPEPVILSDPCAGASLSASIAVPVEPAGRAWDGIARSFKSYGMRFGLGGIDHPDSTSIRIDVPSTCDAGSEKTALAPGAQLTTALTWTPALVTGIPARPGDIPFRVTVSHQASDPPPSGASPTPTTMPSGPAGSRVDLYQGLSVDGTLHVVGDVEPILSAGQAIDTILDSHRFTAWLARQPKRTWSGANVFLVNYQDAGGIVPAGPHWEIDLFREVGVPRNWAIGFVDAFTGKLSKLTFCNDPCDR